MGNFHLHLGVTQLRIRDWKNLNNFFNQKLSPNVSFRSRFFVFFFFRKISSSWGFDWSYQSFHTFFVPLCTIMYVRYVYTILGRGKIYFSLTFTCAPFWKISKTFDGKVCKNYIIAKDGWMYMKAFCAPLCTSSFVCFSN